MKKKDNKIKLKMNAFACRREEQGVHKKKLNRDITSSRPPQSQNETSSTLT